MHIDLLGDKPHPSTEDLSLPNCDEHTKKLAQTRQHLTWVSEALIVIHRRMDGVSKCLQVTVN